MGLMEKDIYDKKYHPTMYPWEYSREISIYNGYVNRRYGFRKRKSEPITYNVIKEYINDSPQQYWRKGDIVRFNSRLVPPISHTENWADWFIIKKDQKKFWNAVPWIAKYSDKQLAIIIGKYKKTKLKYQTFIDYGLVTMLLTGPKAGKTRHYWTAKPFKIRCKYPNKIEFKYMLKIIPPEVINIYNQDREDSNESRNQMIHDIYKIFHKE